MSEAYKAKYDYNNEYGDEIEELIGEVEFAIKAVNEGEQVTEQGKPVNTSYVVKEASTKLARLAIILERMEKDEVSK